MSSGRGRPETNMKIVGWIYTLVALAATVVLAPRATANDEKPIAWLAILILATLRSPFLPSPMLRSPQDGC